MCVRSRIILLSLPAFAAAGTSRSTVTTPSNCAVAVAAATAPSPGDLAAEPGRDPTDVGSARRGLAAAGGGWRVTRRQAGLILWRGVVGVWAAVVVYAFGPWHWRTARDASRRAIALEPKLRDMLRTRVGARSALAPLVDDAVDIVITMARLGRISASCNPLKPSKVYGPCLHPAQLWLHVCLCDPRRTFTERLCHEAGHVLLAIRAKQNKGRDDFAREAAGKIPDDEEWENEETTRRLTDPRDLVRRALLWPDKIMIREYIFRPARTLVLAAAFVAVLVLFAGWLHSG